jgi:hypothetical protein
MGMAESRIDAATLEAQIRDRAAVYTVTERSVGDLVRRLRSGQYRIPIPDAARVSGGTAAEQSKVVEAVLLGLPVRPILLRQDDDGYWTSRLLWLLAGAPTLWALQAFMDDALALCGLEHIPAANGFRYSDMEPLRRSRFEGMPVNVIVFGSETPVAMCFMAACGE